MNRRFVRLMISALAAGFFMTSTAAVAQNVSFEEKKQAELKGSAEHKKVERKTLEQEEGAGPKVSYETDEMAAGAAASEKIELQQAAIKKLQLRIKNTDEDDPAKPELMERLGDMLCQKARYYELRAYDFLSASNEAGARGDTAKQQELLAKKADDEKTGREARDEMLKLYREIIKYHADYPQIDKIRYYMAFNLAEMGYAGEAYEQYSGIVREHSNSKYLPEAFLGMAEYTFAIEEDMPTALQQYQKVVSIDAKSSAASFAMYKMGWCYFNLGEPKKALAQFEKVIREADSGGARRTDMRKEALKDLVKAYSMWDEAKPANARKYFKSFAANDDEVDTMLERLARLYQENGRIEESNYIYNQLIAANVGKFKIVNYQHEIMLNVETMSDPTRLAEEIQRTVLLFVKARDEKFEGATPEAGTTAHWKMEVALTGENAPAVRYTIAETALSDADGCEWFALGATVKTVRGVGFGGSGSVGNFRGFYKAQLVGKFERPNFGAASAGGDALGFGVDPATGKATFAVSIDNASEDAVYGVYVSATVDGDYVLDAAATQSGSGANRTFTMVDDAATKFVKIVAAEPGYDFPDKFSDIEGIE